MCICLFLIVSLDTVASVLFKNISKILPFKLNLRV